MIQDLTSRRQAIVDFVNQHDSVVRFDQLRHYFPNVSDVTLRKDLQNLDEAGCLIRVHGGAKAVPNAKNFLWRSSIHQPEKEMIAEKASLLITENSSVFISGGSTCAELAQKLPNLPMYVFTDGLYVAANCPVNTNITVEIAGGEIDMNVKRVLSLSTLQRLEQVHFNIAFLGTPSFHPEFGFSYLSEMALAIANAVIRHSDKVVLLMDSSKLNYAVTPQLIPLEKIDCIVTDDKMDPEIIKQLQNHNITIL